MPFAVRPIGSSRVYYSIRRRILYTSNKEVTMAFQVYNFENNDDVKIVAQTGQFKVIQWDREDFCPGGRLQC